MREEPGSNDPTNVVALRGKVLRPPEERELPSGAVISSFRISVAREPTVMTKGSRQTTDWFDCTAWSSKAKRTVARWQRGEEVEVMGSVRRRHIAGGSTSMVDVEVIEGRRLR